MRWNRAATVVLAVVAGFATAFLVSGSGAVDGAASSALAKVSTAPSRPPAPSYFVSGRTDGVLRTLTDQTLYYNDQDSATVIACVGTCATVWHPLLLPAGATLTQAPEIAGPLSTITRPDGSMQVAYAGHPLYTYTVDAPGHVTGDGDVDAFLGQAYSWHAATAGSLP